MGPVGSAHPDEPTALLPMAITQAGDDEACVGALAPDGRWIRPEVIGLDQVRDRASSPWRYGRWTSVKLGDPVVEDPRPEDRALLGPPIPAAADGDRWSWAAGLTDTDVATAFADGRSLGLIAADLHRVYLRRATRGRVFARFEFSDASGERFDWIVPEIETAARLIGAADDRGALPAEYAEQVLRGFTEHGPLLLTLGLTRPNNRFPGRFGGCHPLVVGVHPAPRNRQEEV